jgi:arsenite methyltransferase
MTKVEVFDPPMCCSSGVCGPNVDKSLVQFSATLEWLRSRGMQVERYNPTQQYEAFVASATVVKAINEYGTACLPLILVDGEIVSSGGYPGKQELAAMAGVENERTTEKERARS